MKRYKHLFFDLDNTVWDFARNSYLAMLETFRQYRLDTTGFDRFFGIYTAHNDRLWELYRNNLISKQELACQRFSLSFADYGVEEIDCGQFNNDYLALMPLQTHLCDGAFEVLSKLALKYELHIITNGFVEVQHQKLINSGLDGFFKWIFISEEIKAPKPAPEIFHHALKSSNARKSESLMIGDSWETDILGAMKVGIDQVHYAPLESGTCFTDEEALLVAQSATITRRINRLEELFDFL